MKANYVIMPILSLVAGYLFFKGVAIQDIFNIQALLLLSAGLMFGICLGWPLSRIKAAISSANKVISQDISTAKTSMLSELFKVAKHYRLEGPLGLEKVLPEITHPFLKFGAGLVVEGYDETNLKNCLEIENMKAVCDLKSNINLFKSLARLAPALGMAGTVIGLMEAMSHLGNQQALGHALALALSTTLYGLLLAHLLFLPIANKMEEFGAVEGIERSMILDGLLKVLNGEHPLRIAEALDAYDLYLTVSKNIEIQTGLREQDTLLEGQQNG